MLCDIGGTKMRFSSSADGKTISNPVIISTPYSYADALLEFQKQIQHIDPDTIIIGIAGSLNTQKNSLVSAPNLPDWQGRNILDDISHFTNAQIRLENDTALVGLGEAVMGAGKNSDIVVYITISTGVGGVRIVNKKIDVNRYGFEPGHQIVDIDNTACLDCDNLSHVGKGHWDNLVSGKALEERVGMSPRNIHDDTVWDLEAERVAVGVYNTILFWSPDIVVLGGSMITGDPAIDIKKIEVKLQSLMHTFGSLPKIKKATLGEMGGLYGALYYGVNCIKY